MSKPDYTRLDAELLRLIERGFNTFAALLTPKVCEMAKPFCNNEGKPPSRHVPEWRIVDRRLQALRKAAKIRYIGWRWEVL